MTANLAPYLDSVSVKVLINGIDISASVTDVDFNGEYKINDVTTFGYGVSAQGLFIRAGSGN